MTDETFAVLLLLHRNFASIDSRNCACFGLLHPQLRQFKWDGNRTLTVAATP